MSDLVDQVRRLQDRARSARPADTSTEQHRLACEVRYVLDKPLPERRAYLALVDERRRLGAAYLREAVEAEWRRRKEAA